MPTMRDDPTVIALVTRAVNSDKDAWNEIVERYAPLVWSICVRYRLKTQDIEDVGQTVWLLLVEQLGKLREPAALPGWLATTTQRECLRALAVARRTQDAGTLDDAPDVVLDAGAIEQEILTAERNAALRAALGELPLPCQHLLGMFIADPPCSYAEISATLRIPVGSIGPRRARCLDRLRRTKAMARLGANEWRDRRPGGESGA